MQYMSVDSLIESLKTKKGQCGRFETSLDDLDPQTIFVFLTFSTPPPPQKEKNMFNILLLDQIFGHFRISSVKKRGMGKRTSEKKTIKGKASFERLLFP